MKKWRIIITVLAMTICITGFFSMVVIAGETQDDINHFCKEKWGSDYEMQKYCRKQIQKGWIEISSLIELYGKHGTEYKIINQCWHKWYPQLNMVAYCVKNQIEAYQSLK